MLLTPTLANRDSRVSCPIRFLDIRSVGLMISVIPLGLESNIVGSTGSTGASRLHWGSGSQGPYVLLDEAGVALDVKHLPVECLDYLVGLEQPVVVLMHPDISVEDVPLDEQLILLLHLLTNEQLLLQVHIFSLEVVELRLHGLCDLRQPPQNGFVDLRLVLHVRLRVGLMRRVRSSLVRGPSRSRLVPGPSRRDPLLLNLVMLRELVPHRRPRPLRGPWSEPLLEHVLRDRSPTLEF